MRLGQRNATSEVTPRLVVGLHRGTCTAVLTHPSSSRHFVAVSMGRSDASAHPALVGFEKIEVGGGEGGRECGGGGLEFRSLRRTDFKVGGSREAKQSLRRH